MVIITVGCCIAVDRRPRSWPSYWSARNHMGHAKASMTKRIIAIIQVVDALVLYQGRHTSNNIFIDMPR